jgi:hypothetical protein
MTGKAGTSEVHERCIGGTCEVPGRRPAKAAPERIGEPGQLLAEHG